MIVIGQELAHETTRKTIESSVAINDKCATQVRHHVVVFQDVVVAEFIGSAHLGDIAVYGYSNCC